MDSPSLQPHEGVVAVSQLEALFTITRLLHMHQDTTQVIVKLDVDDTLALDQADSHHLQELETASNISPQVQLDAAVDFHQ